MQVSAKATRKELKQIIVVYQSIIEFSLEKMGLEVIIKHNKSDPDAMLDEINAHLIDVCEEYLQSHKLWVDKYQLATIVLDLYTQTISTIPEPFKVIAKESKALVQEYLEKNKSKREALERIIKENEALDKELIAREKEIKQKNREISSNIIEKPEMPSGNLEAGPMGGNAPSPKKKKKGGGVDAYAIDNFILPMG